MQVIVFFEKIKVPENETSAEKVLQENFSRFLQDHIQMQLDCTKLQVLSYHWERTYLQQYNHINEFYGGWDTWS